MCLLRAVQLAPTHPFARAVGAQRRGKPVLDEALPHRERLGLDAHFAVCPHCALYLEQLRETMQLTGSIELEQLSPDAREDLMQAFAAWRATDSP